MIPESLGESGRIRLQWLAHSILPFFLLVLSVTPPSQMSSPSATMLIPQEAQAVPITIGESDAAQWSPRWWHASVVHGGRIWVMGGAGDEEATSDTWYSEDGRRWVQATDSAPWGPRALHAALSFDGHLWILGGNTSGEGDMNDVWRTVDGVEWERVTSSAPWAGRIFHSGVVFDGKMWVLGGVKDWSGPSSIQTSDVWFSSNGVDWTQVADSSSTPAGLYGAVVHDERIWAFNIGPNGGSKVWHTADGETWQLATDAAPFPGRPGFSAVSHAGKIWVLGDSGIWSSSDGAEWSQNVDSETWMPPGFSTSVVHGDRIWVMGGKGMGMSAEQLGGTSAIDPLNGFAYFETDRRRVVKVALGEGSSAPSFVDAVPIGSGTEWPEGRFPGLFEFPTRVRNQGPVLNGPDLSSPLSCGIDCQRGIVRDALRQATSLTSDLPGQIEHRDDGRTVLVSAGSEVCAAASEAELRRTCLENITSAVVDWETGHLYYYSYLPPPGRIVKIALGSDESPPRRVGEADLKPGPGDLRVAGAAVIDAEHGFAYFGTARGPSVRADVVKVALGTNTQPPVIVGTVALEADEVNLASAVIDADRGFAYFSGGISRDRLGKVIKVALGEGASPPQRVGTVRLEEGMYGLRPALIDRDGGYAYFGTGGGRAPAQLVKVALGEGMAAPRVVGTFTFAEAVSGLRNDVWFLEVSDSGQR